MNPIKTLLLFFVAIGSTLMVSAADFSYVFIQGDKKTPIYTKVEGVMMPRYGKNYALLAPLAPGPMNLEILFQQNEHPPLHFQILVPENGKRAFLLSKKEGKFVLYDIQQNFYLQNENAVEDDHLPAVLTNQSIKATNMETTAVVAQQTTTPENIPTEKSIPEPATSITNNSPAVTPNVDSATYSATSEAKAKSEPEFIEGITFDNSRKDSSAVSNTPPPAAGNVADTREPAVVNSDCKTNIPSEKYYRLRGEMKLMPGEDQRLGAIEEAVKKYCFSTKQASELTGLLGSDLARLTALKAFYPKITDQTEYASLAALISDTDTRNYFLNFLKP